MSKQAPSELEKHLENIKIPEVNILPHQRELKLTILNAKRSDSISLWLLIVPFIILAGGVIQSVFHIMLPPWAWLVKYSPLMPIWLRISIFAIILIIIPGIVVLINFLGILWFKYDKKEHVLHIAVRMRRRNVIFIFVCGILALLFICHTALEWISNN
jgi:hypothetical protein